MFPIRDHNPSGRTPYVVYALMAANILIFISYAGAMDDARLINQICDYALVYAYSYERKDVDAAIIQQVIMDRKIYGVFASSTKGSAPFNTVLP